MLARGEAHAAISISPSAPRSASAAAGMSASHLALAWAGPHGGAGAAAARDAAALPHVHVMGAGMWAGRWRGSAADLPVRTVVVDSRAEELAQCPDGVELRRSALPEAEIDRAPPGSAFVVLTHDHALDFLLAAAALARRDAAYVGMIGSATKRARFRRWCREHCDGQPADALVCPIGATGSADKRPEVIAAFVAAEVMAALTREIPPPAAAGQAGG